MKRKRKPAPSWHSLINVVLRNMHKREAKLWAEDAEFIAKSYSAYDESFRRRLAAKSEVWWCGFSAYLISNYPLYQKWQELRKLAIEEFGNPYRCWWV